MTYEHEVADVVETVFSLYEKHGDQDYIGERVSQQEHMIQCAMLAEKEGYPTEVILAALFHDIGHLLGVENNLKKMFSPTGDYLGIVNHEAVGEQFLLELGFPAELCQFVRNHVQAKRYLVWKDKDYHDNPLHSIIAKYNSDDKEHNYAPIDCFLHVSHLDLSEASKGTLLCQGGPMTTEEAKEFERSPNFDLILRMRTWDELGKDVSAPCDPIEKYKQMCFDYLCGN